MNDTVTANRDQAQDAASARPFVVALSGNTRRPSNSRTLAANIGAALEAVADCEVRYLDLVDAGPGLGAAFTPDRLDGPARAVVEAVTRADGLIVSSPVYKGSYPGLLKHLFDLVDPLAFVDRPVLLAAVGGGAKHALVIEHQLRPLFGFFTAFGVPTGIYAAEADFADGRIVEPMLANRVDTAVRQFSRLLGVNACAVDSAPRVVAAAGGMRR